MRYGTITALVAAGTRRSFPAGSEFVAVLEADVTGFKVGTDDQGVGAGYIGMQFVAVRGKYIRTVEVEAPAGTDLNIVLGLTTDGNIVDNRMLGAITCSIDSGSNLDDVADVALTNGVATQVCAAGARKAVLVGNPATNTVVMRVGKAPAADRGIPVYPGQVVTLETQGLVKAFVGAVGQVAAVLFVKA